MDIFFSLFSIVLNMGLIGTWVYILRKRESERSKISWGVICRRCKQDLPKDITEPKYMKIWMSSSVYKTPLDLSYCKSCNREVQLSILDSKFSLIKRLFRMETYQEKNVDRFIKAGVIVSILILLLAVFLSFYGINILILGIKFNSIANAMLAIFNMLNILTTLSFTKRKNTDRNVIV
jgi:hypothetical protein